MPWCGRRLCRDQLILNGSGSSTTWFAHRQVPPTRKARETVAFFLARSDAGRSARAAPPSRCKARCGKPSPRGVDLVAATPYGAGVSRVVLTSITAVLLAAGSAIAAGSEYTASATSACLTSHRVLVSRVPRAQVLPLSLPAVSALRLSFGLIPAQALDNGVIVFERNPATAQRVAAAWFAYDKRQAARVQGVDLSKIKMRLSDVYTVSGNTITAWSSQPVKLASRRIVARCLS